MPVPSSFSPSRLPFSESDATALPPGTTTSESSTQTATASDVPARSEEVSITVADLRDMLARILEQTNALWERQESTNRMLDELRQSIPMPQEHSAWIDERLSRIEILAERLVDQTASGTRHGARESTQESSHGDQAGPSEKQLLGLPSPQTHVSSDTKDQGGVLPHEMVDLWPSPSLDQILASWSISSAERDWVEEQAVASQHGQEEREANEGITQGIEEPQRQNAEQIGLSPLSGLDTCEGDSNRQLEEVTSVARSTADVQNEYCPETTAASSQTLPEPNYAQEMGFQAIQPQFAGRWVLDVKAQLVDVRNLVQRNVDLCQMKNELIEQFFTERQRGEDGRDRQVHELMGMMYWLVKEAGEARQRDESREANDDRPGAAIFAKELEQKSSEQRKLFGILSERLGQATGVLHRQNAKQGELLNAFSESWRADSNRRHEEIMNAIRPVAHEQISLNVEGYLDEFSKALSGEVRMLLGEVGKLREERRNIQHELGYLLTLKSCHGPGGEFSPEWILSSSTDSSPEVTPPTTDPPLPPEAPLPRSAWRPVTLRGRRRPAPVPMPGPVQSWATWQPNPLLIPTSPSAEPAGRRSPGLFGPPSPRD